MNSTMLEWLLIGMLIVAVSCMVSIVLLTGLANRRQPTPDDGMTPEPDQARGRWSCCCRRNRRGSRLSRWVEIQRVIR